MHILILAGGTGEAGKLVEVFHPHSNHDHDIYFALPTQLQMLSDSIKHNGNNGISTSKHTYIQSNWPQLQMLYLLQYIGTMGNRETFIHKEI